MDWNNTNAALSSKVAILCNGGYEPKKSKQGSLPGSAFSQSLPTHQNASKEGDSKEFPFSPWFGIKEVKKITAEVPGIAYPSLDQYITHPHSFTLACEDPTGRVHPEISSTVAAGMHSRWFNIAVVLMWLTTTGWLVTKKIVPSLRIGDPPNYQRILGAQLAHPVVGWNILWNEHPLGWAVSVTSPMPERMTEVRSRIHFEQLPLEDIFPKVLRKWLSIPPGMTRMQVEAHNVMAFDPLGRLSRFESGIGLEPTQNLIKVQGMIEGAKMLLSIRYGENIPKETEVSAPNASLLSDAMSPQGCLPGLRAGQSWTLQTYGPLREPDSPMELLHATVESHVRIPWEGRWVSTWLVVYRSDPGVGVGGSESIRGQQWVLFDGLVVRQEVRVLGSVIRFVRLGDDKAETLLAKARQDGSMDSWGDMGAPQLDPAGRRPAASPGLPASRGQDKTQPKAAEPLPKANTPKANTADKRTDGSKS